MEFDENLFESIPWTSDVSHSLQLRWSKKCFTTN